MARITTETFRTFILDNKSLKTLSLEYLRFEGSPNGPPVDLLDPKSLAANFRLFFTFLHSNASPHP